MPSRELLLAVLACAGLPSFASAQFVPGDLYIDAIDKIYQVDPTNWTFSTFADSSDGLTDSGAIAFSPSDTLLCTNFKTDQLFEFASDGTGSVLYDATDGLSGPHGLVDDASGNLFVADFKSAQILSFPVGGGAASVIADAGDGLFTPTNIAVAPNGCLFVTDYYSGFVWSIDASGLVTTFDTLMEPATIVIRRNGDIYVAAYGINDETVYRYPAGDASQRVALASFPGISLWGAVQLSLDEKTIYFASDDELFTVDAETGVTTMVIDGKQGLSSCWAIAVYRSRATWSNYGVGFPGSYGVPTFTSQADPKLGTTLTVDVANSYGQPTFGVMFAGFQQASMHTAWGGDLLVAPLIALPITFSYGSDSFTGALPDDPLLMDTKLDLQVLESDPGAAKGVSFTPGLELVLGY